MANSVAAARVETPIFRLNRQKALEKLTPPEGAWKRFQADDPLLAFLASL